MDDDGECWNVKKQQSGRQDSRTETMETVIVKDKSEEDKDVGGKMELKRRNEGNEG